VVDAFDFHIASTVIEHCREMDFIIIGHSNSISDRAIGSNFSEHVVISSGRPILVMPPNGHAVFSTGLAIVGWNGSRESARAAFDSIPLLKQVDEVLIAWVSAETESSMSGETPPGAGLARTLARHDIDAKAVVLHSSREAGEVLLERVESRGAGLLVMGAYGHSRLREFILGGATRSVLRGMKYPVLFSH
jgi:nucleotide-binding universal stress UspA family protein